ncbi:hypothetical protein [Paenirhodobacter populi]|uniref:hypothetical protein n=1 Tax=Paenirhodobacter populi TaxID=2306993 RepID=UPI000FE35B25|nr:hypothetical protein [Sinirhodobacter populi]RWR09712.1 hypothetical protein D2T32_05040 [Sinirhodobacter populi]
METGLFRKTLAALAVGLVGVAAQAVAPAIVGPAVAAATAVVVALAVHFTPNTILGANVNEVAAATLRAAYEIGWDMSDDDTVAVDGAENPHQG